MFRRKRDPEPVYGADLWDREHLVWPVQRALMAAFKDLEDWHRSPMLQVPRDYKDPSTAGVVFWLPPWWHCTPELKRTVVSIISTRLGIEEPTASWRLDGIHPRVTVKPRLRLPERVVFNQLHEYISTASDTEPVLGLGLGGQLVTADLEDDSPHILVSAGSGGGKSALTRLIACQALHHGAHVVICDFKRTSHNWAKGLPGVTYCRRIDEIHDALVTLAELADARNEQAEDPDADLGPRVWVILEEMNATSEKLRDYWEIVREKGDPKRSPAIMGMKDLLFMGRSALVHVVAIAQRLDASVVGGGSARENFALRCLTRYTPQAWKMLASDAGNPPKRSKVVGRWVIVAHGEATETQVCWIPEDEARSWALSGRPVRAVEGMKQLAPTPSDLGKQSERVLPVGLRDALPLLPGPPLSLDALRKHAQRDPWFPEPVGEVNGDRVWALDDLAGWRSGRLAAQQTEQAS